MMRATRGFRLSPYSLKELADCVGRALCSIDAAQSDVYQKNQMKSSMPVARVIRQNISLIILVVSLLSARDASAQGCLVDAPQYNLSNDTVTWSLSVVAGSSCIHGVRFGNVHFENLKLISPPQFGKVELQGFGFIYSPKPDFQGRDSFALAMIGAVYGNRGSSTIYVTAFVSPGGTRITSPPLNAAPQPVLFTAPSSGATVSGSLVNLMVSVSYPIESVQFVAGGINAGYIIGGHNIGAAVVSPPYATVWDSTTVGDGSHMLHAVAKDIAGNYKIASVLVIVKNK
jgi:hypothetical protein